MTATLEQPSALLAVAPCRVTLPFVRTGRGRDEPPPGFNCVVKGSCSAGRSLNRYVLFREELRQVPVHIGRIGIRLQPHHRSPQLLFNQLPTFDLSGNDDCINTMLVTKKKNLADI